ncbi:MAG: hypothetical protein FWH27_05845, partial [Planctomycetaceae bacterium]|nr:hypothetical protein [Planctomycetaceae bacterium]
DHIPTILKEQVFEKAFHTAEVAVMTRAERDRYEQESNDYLTYWATLKTAEKRGLKKGVKKGIDIGKAEGKAEGEIQKAIDIARNLKKKGLDADFIAETTGLSPEEIEQLD